MTTIELRNVSRWYGNVVAVNDITMTVGPGVTGLLGPNGAGKSTVLHLIAGFLEPSRGELTVAGAPSWRNPEIFRTIGLVPERDSVYAFLTGAQFVTATAKLHEIADPGAATRRAIEMVEMAQAQDRRISTYSKGMRQRVLIAASLLHDPKLLIFDEPLSGLDVVTARLFKDLVELLAAEGKAVLYISHVLEVVEQVCNRVIVIAKGRVLADAPPAALTKLMSLPNLESVFSQLVQQQDTRSLAQQMVEVVRNNHA